jgi:hypothetical protein
MKSSQRLARTVRPTRQGGKKQFDEIHVPRRRTIARDAGLERVRPLIVIAHGRW